MKKSRTFKTKIVISYILVVFIVGIIFSVTHYLVILQSFVKLNNDEKRSIKGHTVFVRDLQYKSLKLLENHFVLQITRHVSDILSIFIMDKDFKTFLDTKGGKQFESLIQKIIYRDEKKIGKIIIINDKGNITFDSDDLFAGKNYAILKNTSPNYYMTIKKYNKQPEASGCFAVKSMDRSSRNVQDLKFFASRYLPENSLTLFFFLKVPAQVVGKILDELVSREQMEQSIQVQKMNKIDIDTLINLGISFFIILIILIILTAIFGSRFAKTVAQPIVELKDAVKKIGKGDFNVKVDDKRGTRETVQLAETFNMLGTNLSDYMEKLKTEITARTILENEIKLAKGIQQSILPSVLSMFDNDHFSLYSKLFPAKEVSGDFYDFFFLGPDRNTLVFLVADVSGKGIPAAFFMGIAKTIIKNVSLLNKTLDPGEVLAKANTVLSQDNDEFMFVTAFLAYYKLNTGELSYANAGHHKATRIAKDHRTDKFGDMKNPALGFDGDQKYSCGKEQVNIGDKLILYTDGITDALLGDNVYGQSRLDKILVDNADLSPEALCKLVLNDVDNFQKGKLFDDITMLTFTRNS